MARFLPGKSPQVRSSPSIKLLYLSKTTYLSNDYAFLVIDGKQKTQPQQRNNKQPWYKGFLDIKVKLLIKWNYEYI